jgi:hypothetical protein
MRAAFAGEIDMVIRKIGVLSLGKLMGVMYAGIGLLFGVLYALFAVVGGGAMMAMGGDGESALGGGMMMGIGLAAVVVAPIFYGILGFIGGVISAFFFNLAAKYAGGLEIEVQ